MIKTIKDWMFSFLVLLVSVTLLSGCALWNKAWTNTYEEDYTKTHKEFLDYTLGDWKILKSEKGHYTSKNENEMGRNYLSWNIQYSDQNGDVLTLHLENDKDMGENLIKHTENLLKQEFEKEIGEPTFFYLGDPYLTTSWSDSTKAYREHPEKLTENYKDVFKFQDFTPERPFENSPVYLSIGFDYKNSQLTDNEKVAKWDETRTKMLKIAPHINMKVELEVNDSLTKYLYYVDGENVGEVDYEKYLRTKYPQFDETDLAKDK
ncbi:hypothetical protein [Neobacillus sp. D3-1R]|uniref:hypothetical protein n=1 Tax=Neobacillus sp. D3-1R TaxID=3445778 RepID=UPI003F9F5C58